MAQTVELTEREMEACDALWFAVRDTRKQDRKWSYKSLAEAVGTTYDVLNNMAARRTSPDYDLLESVRKVLGLPEGWPNLPKEKDEPKRQRTGEVVSIVGTPLKPLSLAGSTAAGDGAYNVDAENRIVHVPSRLADLGDTAFVIDGDSMMPMLKDADVAVFKRRSMPKDGCVFLMKLENDSLVTKLVVYSRHDWQMVSLNPKHGQKPVPDSAQLLGVLMGWYRIEGTRETMDLDTDYLRPDTHQLRNFSI